MSGQIDRSLILKINICLDYHVYISAENKKLNLNDNSVKYILKKQNHGYFELKILC